MGRKNRRRGGRELGQDVIREILTGKPTLHVTKEVSHPEGMRTEAVIVDDPAKESEADKACRRAGIACDRIIGELDEELRRHHHGGQSS